jgi:outer membrane protein assembly factor BamE (lipoprotein component of BamABCDE complex)
MPSFYRFFVVISLVVFMLTGCYNTPVRHLASDVSLIKIGKSHREDVLVYLGEPDLQRMVSASQEEWVYIEEKESSFQKTPFVGRAFSPEGYGRVVVTFEGDLVTGCRYSAYEEKDMDWKDDFDWQKKQK